MTHAGRRSLVGLFAMAMLSLLISAAQAQAPVSINPKTAKAGTAATLTISSNGFFDLSKITASQISINPNTGVSNLAVSNASAQSLTVSFNLAAQATPGQRMLSIDANDVVVSLKLTVEPAAFVCNPATNCRPPRTCENNTCVTPACSTLNCRAPNFCDGDTCVRGCRPACRPPRPFCNNGTCSSRPPE